MLCWGCLTVRLTQSLQADGADVMFGRSEADVHVSSCAVRRKQSGALWLFLSHHRKLIM